jgi:hypothetical protein
MQLMTETIKDVYDAAARYMMPDVTLVPCEIALVFGTRHGVGAFVDDTVRLWEEKMFKRVVVSGGSARGPGASEAEVIGSELIRRGIAEDRVLFETRAENTLQNVCYSLDLLREHQIDTATTVLGIGKLCSLRRYYMTLAKHWPHAKRACVHGINYFGVPKSSWWKNDEFRTRVFSELAKLELYAVKGDLTEVGAI